MTSRCAEALHGTCAAAGRGRRRWPARPRLPSCRGCCPPACLYIGNDSGPKHIAAALGRADDRHPFRRGRRGRMGAGRPRAVALQRNMTCSPCYLAKAEDCPRALACLRRWNRAGAQRGNHAAGASGRRQVTVATPPAKPVAAAPQRPDAARPPAAEAAFARPHVSACRPDPWTTQPCSSWPSALATEAGEPSSQIRTPRFRGAAQGGPLAWSPRPTTPPRQSSSPACAPRLPDCPVIAEEEVAGRPHDRRPSAQFWLVDPLDGTREFTGGRDDFAVNIGLVRDGRAALGVVGVPGRPARCSAASSARCMEAHRRRQTPIAARLRRPTA